MPNLAHESVLCVIPFCFFLKFAFNFLFPFSILLLPATLFFWVVTAHSQMQRGNQTGEVNRWGGGRGKREPNAEGKSDRWGEQVRRWKGQEGAKCRGEIRQVRWTGEEVEGVRGSQMQRGNQTGEVNRWGGGRGKREPNAEGKSDRWGEQMRRWKG